VCLPERSGKNRSDGACKGERKERGGLRGQGSEGGSSRKGERKGRKRTLKGGRFCFTPPKRSGEGRSKAAGGVGKWKQRQIPQYQEGGHQGWNPRKTEPGEKMDGSP